MRVVQYLGLVKIDPISGWRGLKHFAIRRAHCTLIWAYHSNSWSIISKLIMGITEQTHYRTSCPGVIARSHARACWIELELPLRWSIKPLDCAYFSIDLIWREISSWTDKRIRMRRVSREIASLVILVGETFNVLRVDSESGINCEKTSVFISLTEVPVYSNVKLLVLNRAIAL